MVSRRASVMTLLLVGVAGAGCLRAPIRDDTGGGGTGDAGDAEGTSSGGADQTGDSTGSTGSTTDTPGDVCHPSYVPCLPIVDELNCPEVVELGAAPVTVIGPDVYGLDSDNDGIGCEN